MHEFGITFKADMPPARIVDLTRWAEASDFTHGWSFDSHILWQDPYPLLTLTAINTRRMQLGTCVTNHVVRDSTVTASLLATLNRISGGWIHVGIGRGDSSRRVMGKTLTTLRRLEESVALIRNLTGGKQVVYEGQAIRTPWADADVPPVWVAGDGPSTLCCAGRVVDGVILQFADTHLIRWCLGSVREGAEPASRDFSRIQVMSATAVWVSDNLARARQQVRWFSALVSNHVVDLILRYKPKELPEELTAYVRDRKGYDYLHHAEVSSVNANFVSDEIVDRNFVVGPVEAHLHRLRELQASGVMQLNIYLMNSDKEVTLEAYARDIIPALSQG